MANRQHQSFTESYDTLSYIRDDTMPPAYVNTSVPATVLLLKALF